MINCRAILEGVWDEIWDATMFELEAVKAGIPQVKSLPLLFLPSY
jgi:hypothetical protein